MWENVGNCPFEDIGVYPMTALRQCRRAFYCKKSAPAEQVLICVCEKLVLLVTDVLCLSGIESEVADSCYQTVDTEGDHGQEDVSTGSAGKALGLQRAVVNDQAADPTQEKCEKKTNQIIVHLNVLLILLG